FPGSARRDPGYCPAAIHSERRLRQDARNYHQAFTAEGDRGLLQRSLVRDLGRAGQKFPPYARRREKDLVMDKIGEPVCRIKVQPIPSPAEASAQKEIEAHIERVWVAYCSRC